MENQNETAGTNNAPQLTPIENCIEHMDFLTKELENIVGLGPQALLGDPICVDSAGLKRWREDVRNILSGFFIEHKVALSTVIALDRLEKINPLSTRFVKAVDAFEIKAAKLIDVIEKFEELYLGQAS